MECKPDLSLVTAHTACPSSTCRQNIPIYFRVHWVTDGIWTAVIYFFLFILDILESLNWNYSKKRYQMKQKNKPQVLCLLLRLSPGFLCLIYNVSGEVLWRKSQTSSIVNGKPWWLHLPWLTKRIHRRRGTEDFVSYLLITGDILKNYGKVAMKE